ncbi:MAG: SBBP repeat-containing protein, partial [Bacteroidetes bacterium]|nr:SBBP repeat-containing protein [Bacteroidota bacterium]
MKKNTFLFVYLVFFCFVNQGQNTKSPDEIKNLLEIKNELLKNGNSTEFDKHKENYFSDTWKSSINDYGDPPDWNWVSQFGGSGEDHARDIISDSEGNIYVTGSFAGEISVESNSYTSIGQWDAFVAKFQSTGNLIWFKQFSAEAEEQIESYGINLDNSGNLFITGYFTGNVILDNINLYGWDVKNGFFAKMDNQGTVLMAQSCDWYDEIGYSIDTDENANIYLLSSISGQPAIYYYTRIMKYDPDGYLLWDNYFDHNFNDLEVFGTSLYFTGTIWTPGYIGDFYFEPDYYDAFIAKADLELDFEWAVMAGHEAFGWSTGIGLYLNQNEEMFITGRYQTDMIWGGNQLEGINGFIAKFNSSGESLWSSSYTEEENTNYQPACICGDNNSAYISYWYSSYPYPTETNVVSQFSTSTGDLINSAVIDFNVEAIRFNPFDNKIAVAGGQDQLNVISQLNNDMTELWKLQFEGNSAFGDIIGMGIDQYGFMYVYGYASNTLDYFGHTINKGLFLAKQGTTGHVFWLKQFPDVYGSHDLGSYLVTDTLSENVYITGTFFEPLIIPGGSTLIPEEDGSIFIIKYDFNGNYQWAVQEDFYSDELCLTPDYSGNILLSGIFSDTISMGTTNLISAGMRDVFVSKYNSQGSFQWARRAGGEDIEYLGLISIDAMNNIYLTG